MNTRIPSGNVNSFNVNLTKMGKYIRVTATWHDKDDKLLSREVVNFSIANLSEEIEQFLTDCVAKTKEA